MQARMCTGQSSGKLPQAGIVTFIKKSILNEFATSINMTTPLMKGIRIEILSIIWMLIEASVSIVAGIAASSTLLIAFGADSIIEIVSATALLWRLTVEARETSQQKIGRAERVAQWIVAFSLLLLCLYVLVTSVFGLLKHSVPDHSLTGICVTLVAVIVMPLLARNKKRIAHEIGSKALGGDAACSMTCAYMAGTVLLGLALTALFHWWWAEHIAALLFLYWLFGETREAFGILRNREATCSCC
jgi:divalent metal cation (Fe/Co/Zn/Cd) transporter